MRGPQGWQSRPRKLQAAHPRVLDRRHEGRARGRDHQSDGLGSNFAQIFDAIAEFDKGTTTDKDKGEHVDTFWQVKIPNPLPATGAKVTVKGDYASTFSKSSTGAEADPFMGMLTYEEMTVNEPASELSTLPGVKRKEKK